MRIEERTITYAYKVFDIGEKVRPVSNRSVLKPGIYTVTEFIAPSLDEPNASSSVFVEGHSYGVSTEYLESLWVRSAESVDEPESVDEAVPGDQSGEE